MMTGRKRNQKSSAQTTRRKRKRRNEDTVIILSSDDESAVESSSVEGSVPRSRPFREVRKKIQSYCEILDNDLDQVNFSNKGCFDLEKQLATLTLKDLNRILCTGDDVQKYLKVPNFRSTMRGVFIRVHMVAGVYDVSSSQAFQIRDVIEGNQSYRVGGISTKFIFQVRDGRQQQSFKLDCMSSKKMTEKDFERWTNRMRKDYSKEESTRLLNDVVIPSKEFIEMKERDILQMNFQSGKKFKSSDRENLFKKTYFEKLDLSERSGLLDCTNQASSTLQVKDNESEERTLGSVVSKNTLKETEDRIVSDLTSGSRLEIAYDLHLSDQNSCVNTGVEITEKPFSDICPILGGTDSEVLYQNPKAYICPGLGDIDLAVVYRNPIVAVQCDVAPVVEIENMEVEVGESVQLCLEGNKQKYRLLDDPVEILLRLFEKRDEVVRHFNRKRKAEGGQEYEKNYLYFDPGA